MALLPWEPIIRAAREEFEFDFVPDTGDCCDCCGKELVDLMVSNNRGWNFCSWECTLKVAEMFPPLFHIESIGAY